MKTRICILILAFALVYNIACEKDDMPCIKKIEHFTFSPGQDDHKTILIFYSVVVPEDFIQGNEHHRFVVLEDCTKN